MVQNNVEYSLLMASDAEGQNEFELRSPVTRRDPKMPSAVSTKIEACGKTRLFMLSLFATCLILITIASSRVQLPQIVVRVPPDENQEVPFTLHHHPDHPEKSTFVYATTTVSPADTNASVPVPQGYLVWSNSCKIASLNPMAADVMKLYYREKPISCSSKVPLTNVFWDAQKQKYYLRVVKEAQKAYSFRSESSCVCKEVVRKSENQIGYSSGVKFTSTLELSIGIEFLFVECYQSGQKKPIYKNVHLVVQRKPSIINRLEELKAVRPAEIVEEQPSHGKPLSVLMVGIDSISRLNLLRAMPSTAQHLYDNGWFEMKGYNKMGDNTYPNLMAVLTGYNETWAYDKCRPHDEKGLDECPFVWKDYAAAGFVTGYAEDEPTIGTFNYHKKGFSVDPTDFYGRSGMLAANKLPKVVRSSLAICLGGQTAADYIYKYGFDITETFQEQGTFGLYWTNSFSHNDLNTPSSMDDRVKHYLQELETRSILNDSIVIFFSDHGIRFGPIRKLVTGWMEERLPFLFFWLPVWFREKYPEIVQALKVNRNRLTNPYDLHLTLKHILRLTGRLPPEKLAAPSKDVAMGCEKCQSMFKEMPWNRSCEEIGIAAHWCTCAPYLPINKESRLVKRASKFLLDYINKIIQRVPKKSNGDPLCADLHLRTVYFAGETEYKSDYNDILIQFETWPGGGEFESTVRYIKAMDQFHVTGTISRLNTYSKHSDCAKEEHLQMYCECL